MLTDLEIASILNQEVYSAEARLKDARRVLDAMIVDTPSMLPHPDGQLELANARRERNNAREVLQRAVKRSFDFTLNGIIPDDLKTKQSDIV